jgi:two-component system chemotaxis response regulator CheB
MRSIVVKALQAEPCIEVVGVASDGMKCMERIRALSPDIVSLDVEMPGMDGIETVAAIRKEHADLPIVMFSSFTKRGAEVTISALLNGASDYATKPASVLGGDGGEAAIAAVRRDLVPKLLRLAGNVYEKLDAKACRAPEEASSSSTQGGVHSLAGIKRGALECRPEIIVVAASTGGPNVLATFLGGLPADFPVPVAIVQHMPALFVKILADRLDGCSPLSVRELISPTALKPGEVWLAPGDFHMELSGSEGRAFLRPRGPDTADHCVPSADILFESAAHVCGRAVLGIVMTGMGRDGANGALEICKAGGRIYAQDLASSVVWGMPGAVCNGGMASKVLPAAQLARETVRAVSGAPVSEDFVASQRETSTE